MKYKNERSVITVTRKDVTYDVHAGGRRGLKGDDGSSGADGRSAYQVWLDEGNTGTEQDFLDSLKGNDGDPGPQGPQGNPGNDGIMTSIVAGDNITVDDTDPANPIVSASIESAVDSVNGQTGTVVLDTDDVSDSGATNKYVTAAEKTKLANTSGTNTGDQTLSGLGGVPTSRTINGQDLSTNRTLTQDNIGDGTTYKQYSQTEKTKLSGIATGATANDTDANLKNRANHTGTQIASTISDFSTAADARITAQKGNANGLAELDSGGLVPSSQLPSYVDDVLVYANLAAFPVTGATGKIYIAEDTNLTYRWSGSAYVEISASLALGETSSTAYRGDRGKTAYDHSQLTSGNPHNVTKSDVSLGNVDNTSDATKNSAAVALTNKTISGSSNTITNIGNAALTNSAITIAGTSTSLGGSITLDTITGLSSTGLVKRSGSNALAIAVAGTDYLAFSGTTKITVATSAPGSPNVGDIWVDSN